MDDVPSQVDYEELAHELFSGLSAIERLHAPAMRNATRGEVPLMHVLAEKGPLTPSQLAEASMVSSARIANILRALEEKGLVTREHSDRDRRMVQVSLTERGRALWRARREEGDRIVSAYLRELGPDDARSLVRIVRRTEQIMRARRAAEAACGDPAAGGVAPRAGADPRGGGRS